jgi:excisionase family DNA binding protein
MRSERLTMSVEEASGALGISRSLAYELVRRGEIPSLRLGRRIVVPVRALDDLVEVGPSRRSVTSGPDGLGR